MGRTVNPRFRPVPARAAWVVLPCVWLVWSCANADLQAPARAGREVSEGAVVRGPREGHRLALVFTGHEFAEGGETILDELAKHCARASFFLTGDFLANPRFEPLVRRIVKEGHYLGPHSDKHLLYCTWDQGRKTLVAKEAFAADLRA